MTLRRQSSGNERCRCCGMHLPREDSLAHVVSPERWAERVRELRTEVERLRQGLWDVAALAGIDTDGDTTPRHLAYPDIVKWAHDAVRELREDYDDALKNG